MLEKLKNEMEKLVKENNKMFMKGVKMRDSEHEKLT